MMAAETLRLAWLQQWRNKARLLCTVMTLTAILAPLLVLFGLKYGLVSNLRSELQNTPSTMEITLTAGHSFSKEDLARIRAWAETGYLQAETGALYSKVSVQPLGEAPAPVSYALLTSSPGDPDLELSGLKAPGPGEVVLTEALARKLGLGMGANIGLSAWRNGYQESSTWECRISGVLPEARNLSMSVYVPAAMAEQVRDYMIAGAGLPDSEESISEASYHAIVLPGESARTADLLCRRYSGLRPETAGEETHPGIPAGTLVLSAPAGIAAGVAEEMLSLARSSRTAAYPWCRPLKIRADLNGSPCEIQLICHRGEDELSADICPPPYAFCAAGKRENGTAVLHLPCAGGDSDLSCTLTEHPDAAPGTFLLPPQVMALCHWGTSTPLHWDSRIGGLHRTNTKCYSIRLYADTPEHTRPLLEKLRAMGVPCRAELATIDQFLHLEKALDTLFLLLSCSGGAGALISLSMSLFNATELHRRQYAAVRLMGAGRFSLSLIPMAGALLQTAAAAVFSLAVFGGLSYLISRFFAPVEQGAALCRMEPQHAVLFFLLCLAAAWVASLAAAVKVLCITPSEILRES